MDLASATEPADEDDFDDQKDIITQARERRRRNGRKLAAVHDHWVNGELVARVSHLTESISPHLAETIDDPASVRTVPASNPAPAVLAKSAVAPGLVSGPDVSPASVVEPNDTDSVLSSGLISDAEPCPVPAPAAAQEPLVHPADADVDVSGPPALTGPDDPDVDGQPIPAGTKLPSACATLWHCKLPTDGSYKWGEIPQADNLRAVRRFSLKFSWVDWATAEDWIWIKFQEQASDILWAPRRQRDMENAEALANGLAELHKEPEQRNNKKVETVSVVLQDGAAAESVDAMEVCRQLYRVEGS
ncbi:hypothetical protein FPQ18DRAFT_406854 [Pyronema domesticum]|nr:hypothetical protein FPQ18DRAFT_406854 [Pyronema domesticum]